MQKPRKERRQPIFSREVPAEQYVKRNFPHLDKLSPRLFKKLVGIHGNMHLNRLEQYRHSRNELVLAMKKTKKGNPKHDAIKHYLVELNGRRTRWSNSDNPLLDRRSHRPKK